MENIINKELSEQLNKLWLLDNFETEYIYHNILIDYLWMDDQWNVEWINNEIDVDEIYEANQKLSEFKRIKNYCLNFNEEYFAKEYETLWATLHFSKDEYIAWYKEMNTQTLEKFKWELKFFKTLTLSEFKSFLKSNINENIIKNYFSDNLSVFYFDINEAEKMLKYLLDNDLIKK